MATATPTATHTPTPVPNDDKASAQPIKQPTAISMDVRRATIEQDDPIFTCQLLGPQSHTVWYVYTPSLPQQVLTLNTAGSSYDTIMGVWRMHSGGLDPKACNNDYGDVRQARIDNLLVDAGETYLIGIAANDAIGDWAADLCRYRSCAYSHAHTH
ncbi:MAG: hypothetical protein HC911_18085 [Chloroflexaceae bacterium]|nr:hypothetical protein [Chloroflexaceae bacterium]